MGLCLTNIAPKLKEMKRSIVLSSLLLVLCTSAKCARVPESVIDLSMALLPNGDRVASGVQTTDLLEAECCKGGTCTRNVVTGKTECECPPGQGWYLSKAFGVNECRDCKCGGNQHNCTFAPTQLSENKQCKCSAGYAEKMGFCEECECDEPHLHCAFRCLFGKCFKTCTCRDGYVEKDGICEAVDSCFKRPCQNGATCIANGTEYSCLCSAGYTGRNCESPIDPCQSDPCKNNGTCIRSNSFNFTCVCPPPYTGDTCETTIDPCQRLPCKNGGTCIPSNDSDYTCVCPCTHTGNWCEKVVSTVCLPNPCKNGGNCSLLDDGGYLCACPKWYAGKNCDQDKWCVEGPGRFLCKSGTCSFDHEKEQGYCRCTQNRELSPTEAMLLKLGRR